MCPVFGCAKKCVSIRDYLHVLFIGGWGSDGRENMLTLSCPSVPHGTGAHNFWSICVKCAQLGDIGKIYRLKTKSCSPPTCISDLTPQTFGNFSLCASNAWRAAN